LQSNRTAATANTTLSRLSADIRHPGTIAAAHTTPRELFSVTLKISILYTHEFTRLVLINGAYGISIRDTQHTARLETIDVVTSEGLRIFALQGQQHLIDTNALSTIGHRDRCERFTTLYSVLS
jgi:hypothetical protein